MRLLLVISSWLMMNLSVQAVEVWIGTSSRAPSKGIYHCRLDMESGSLSEPTLAAEIRGPGFLAMHPEKAVLYAVGDFEGEPSLVAYQISSTDGPKLTLLNAHEIGDGGATHLAVDKTGSSVLTAQYGGGSTAAFSLNSDGSIKSRTHLIDHQGASNVNPRRQEKPHAHWVGLSPDNRFAFVPDLGMDKVVIYKFDAETSGIAPHGFADLPAGAGPRHMKFHPNGSWAYVLNELDLTVSLFDYDASAGTMSRRQTVATVSKAELAKEKFKSCSEIRIHPSGKFAYAANRGHDTITVFRIDQQSGELAFVELEPIRGAMPRNFNLDPSGRWLLAGGQNSHTLASFEINQQTGELTFTQQVVHAPSAICVLFQHE